jgi:hypothetical protein
MTLYSFQRIARVEQLFRDGVLVSDRNRLRWFDRDAYPAMERAGVGTGWSGHLLSRPAGQIASGARGPALPPDSRRSSGVQG